MPEEQQGEEEEDDDEEMDEEYTPEMAQELMRRGLILSKPKLAAPQLAVLGIIASLTQRCVVIQIHGALSFLALLLFHANKPLNVCKVEIDSRLPLKSSRNAQFLKLTYLQLRISKMGNTVACLPYSYAS